MIDSKELDLSTLPIDVLDNASFYGRIFARSGGVSDAIKQAIKEQNIKFDFNPVACDGIEDCRVALLKLSKKYASKQFY